MEGNRICRQIEWYQNEEHVAALREGRTGYPWIDAIMRQMVQEGSYFFCDIVLYLCDVFNSQFMNHKYNFRFHASHLQICIDFIRLPG